MEQLEARVKAYDSWQATQECVDELMEDLDVLAAELRHGVGDSAVRARAEQAIEAAELLLDFAAERHAFMGETGLTLQPSGRMEPTPGETESGRIKAGEVHRLLADHYSRIVKLIGSSTGDLEILGHARDQVHAYAYTVSGAICAWFVLPYNSDLNIGEMLSKPEPVTRLEMRREFYSTLGLSQDRNLSVDQEVAALDTMMKHIRKECVNSNQAFFRLFELHQRWIGEHRNMEVESKYNITIPTRVSRKSRRSQDAN